MNESKNYLIGTLTELDTLAAELITTIKYPLILLIGELGAGKTTLIKKVLEKLGSDDIGSSPSYAIINEYQTKNNKLYHIDLYRLSSADEVFQLGIEDYLYSGDFCFVEWPQIIMDYIDEPYHIIKIEIMENNDRKITLV